MAQDQFQRVRALMREGRLEEARNLLRTIDHPAAQQMLEVVEQAIAARQAGQQSAFSSLPGIPQAGGDAPGTVSGGALPTGGTPSTGGVTLSGGAQAGSGAQQPGAFASLPQSGQFPPGTQFPPGAQPVPPVETNINEDQLAQVEDQARELAGQGRYDDAIRLLQGIAHPALEGMLAQFMRIGANMGRMSGGLDLKIGNLGPLGIHVGLDSQGRPRLNIGGLFDTGTGRTSLGGEVRTRELGTYEMLWDCKYCGTAKLLGKTHRHCPNCGAAQDPNTRYFPSDEEKVAVEDHVLVGKDLVCNTCGALNAGNANFCGTCGADLANATPAATLAEEVRAAGETFASSGSRDVTQEKFDHEMERIGLKPQAKAAGGMKSWQVIAIVAVVIAVIGGLIFALTATREATVQVTGHSWERQIAVERYQTYTEGTWCDSVPFSGRVISRDTRQRSTNRIPDGEECSVRRVDNGDGTFREVEDCRTIYREEPVYDSYCTYQIDRWGYDRTLTMQGNSLNDNIVWPNFSPSCSGNRIGCEREQNRDETYTVHFREQETDNTFDCGFDDQATWRSYGIETRWVMNVGQVISTPRCDSLQRAN